jgi:putative membrane protein
VASVPQPGQFTIRDYRLLARAVHGNEMEFIFGQIGNEKSTDSTVRAFTQHILDDHRKTDDALTKLIKSKSATAPQAVDVADTTVLRQLNAVSGSDFDRRYMAAMVREYQTAVQDLQNVSANANDSELRAWAVQTLPVWQEHLQMAQNTDATVTGDM